MTNEELVALIQGGERDRLYELWAQVRRMAMREANKWAVYRSGGADAEDLEQAGFLALMRAVDSFDPAAGTKLSTWYYRFLLDEFERATGRRTEKQRRDPLHSAVSLDAPLDTDELEAVTLVDTIPDDQAADAFWAAERREDVRRLRAVLMGAINTLPQAQKSAVVARYWHGERVTAQPLNRAMRALRHPRIAKQLREFL